MKDQIEAVVKRRLFKFIKNRRQGYIEPQRKGTPKGDPIGFSRKKYYAALLCITDMSLSDIAALSNVSYNLLRKWRTESDFLKSIDDNIKGFCDTMEV